MSDEALIDLGEHIASAISDEIVITFDDVNKWYGEFHVLKDINLAVRKGERIVICGPSGSGKSTLIRCINRLEPHQDGHICGQRGESRRQRQEYRCHPQRCWNGVSELQLVSASHCDGELHAGSHVGKEDAQGGGRCDRREVSGAREDPRAGAESTRVSSPAASSNASPSPDLCV